MNTKDEIIPYNDQGTIYYRNAAKSNRYGCELGVRTEILRGLELAATWTWSHFRYGSYEGLSLKVDSTGLPVQSGQDFSGNTLPGTPPNNLLVTLSYTGQIGKHLNFFARARYQGVGAAWTDDANTAKASGYNLLNGLLGLNLAFGKFGIMASGGMNNILDEVYAGYTDINAAGMRFYEAGAPRNWYVSLSVSLRL